MSIKLDYIVIPTLGRTENQVTYNNLPDKWKQKVRFVVQPHEFFTMHSKYPGQVVKLPEDIKGFAATRMWMWEHFKDNVYWYFDDDCSFQMKVPNGLNEKGTQSWKSLEMTDKDFDEMFEWAEEQMNSGIHYGGVQTTTTIPSISYYPVRKTCRITANSFYNAPMLPKTEDLEWCRALAAEDYDLVLQLLTRGYKNHCSTHYQIGQGTQKEGGCYTYRDLKFHNDSQLALAELWPQYITKKEKELPNGDIKINLTIQTAKAYKDSQKTQVNTLF